MAPSVLTAFPPTPASRLTSGSGLSQSHTRQVSHTFSDGAFSSNVFARQSTHRRSSSGKLGVPEASNISNVVYSLKRRSSAELGSETSAKLLNTTYDSILEWISGQRMRQLPAEGSNYDKVLAWARLFVERLHMFELAIEEFAGDSYLATQLAYGYCALLLQLGKENSSALVVSFGLFHSMSEPLVNLLERTKMINVSPEIQEHLVQALSDLVTLVASVSGHLHKVVNGLTESSAYINLYAIFPTEIKAFVSRCEKASQSIWKNELMKEGMDSSKASDVVSIKTWLAPNDKVAKDAVNSTSRMVHSREELTCLWVTPYLNRFLKSEQKTLAISGKPGSGKTILSTVIVDCLQHPIGGVGYNALFVPIDARVPVETTSSAIAKAILSRLFESRIGNIQLLEVLADAHERIQKATTDEEHDEILWKAFSDALACPLPGAKELILVVDGTQNASCGEEQLLQRLSNGVNAVANVRLIVLGREKPSAPSRESSLTSVSITEDLIFDDILAVVRSQFSQTEAFSSMQELDQETVVTRIAKASGGSFLWAKLAAKSLRQSSGADNLQKAVDKIVNSSPSIAELVTRAVASSGVKAEAKHMLLWLSTAERPLSLKEINLLATAHANKDTQPDETNGKLLDTLKPVSSLVFLQDGLVFLRHGLIRTAILDVFARGELVPDVKDRHEDLTTRLLRYIKNCVTQEHHISLTPLDGHNTRQLMARHPLLDFAIRYWPAHARSTLVFSKDGAAGMAKSFAKVIPASTTVVLLQGAVWQDCPAPLHLKNQTMVTDMYSRLLSLRDLVTLQSVILQGMLYRHVGRTDDAISLLYNATTMAKDILGPRDSVTSRLANYFIEMTSTKVTDVKSGIMKNRGEILVLLADCYKIQYGLESDKYVSILQLLLEHYQVTGQEKMARQVEQSIGSTSADEIDGDDDDARVRLRRHRKVEAGEEGVILSLDVEEHDELAEGSYDIELSLKKVEKQMADGKWDLVEQTYIGIWQRASRQYQLHRSDVWEKRMLTAVLGYSKFLKSQKRVDDASSIVSSVWEDYKTRDVMTMTETSTGLLHQMSRVMKEVGLYSESLSVLKHIAGYYQSINDTRSSTYREIEQSIQTESREMIQLISASDTRVTSESILEDMVLETCKSGTIDQTTLAAVFKLVDLYTSQYRWKDATRLIKRVLRSLWPSLLIPSTQDITIPAKHTDECIDLAQRLAECYHTRRRPEKEAEVRVRVYHAMRSSRKVDDRLRDIATLQLMRFYEDQSQTDNLIEINQQVLHDLTNHYGQKHPTVIKMLWKLAELTRPREIFIQYYQKIISALNQDTEATKPEVFEPLAIVANEFWSKGHYADALPYYKLLFTAFLKDPKLDRRLQSQSFMRNVFERYTHCMKDVGSEFSVIYKAMADYRAQCNAVHGSNASITIHATLTLAKACQYSERHELEAIQLYEELLQTDSNEINRGDISAIIDSIYDEQVDLVASHGSEAASSTQVDRAVHIVEQRITTLRENHGWAHEETLSNLSQLVRLRSQRNETEKVLTELRSATVNVLSTETSASRLMAAASTIASGYVVANQVQKITEIQEEIYRQVVMKDTTSAATHDFNVSSCGRDSLVFLAQLEYTLRRNAAVFTEILASLTSQFMLFEEVRQLRKSKSSSMHQLTVATARLYHFLSSSGREAAATSVFKDFVAHFLENEGKRVQLTKPSQAEIFLKTLLQHFGTHKSRDFVRSVGISGNDGVVHLLAAKRYQEACDLAAATFTYITAQDSYRAPTVAKLVLTLGVSIAGRDLVPAPDASARKNMLETSNTIIRDVLQVLGNLNVSIEKIGFGHLSTMVGLLGEQRDYRTLSWLLTVLWNSREAQDNWHPSIMLSLGQRYITARYLVGDSSSAVRLAEDIAYNCRRVHGVRHPATLAMSVFLTQLYNTVAQRHQSQKTGQDMAARYYRKSAGVHETIIRVFTDPSYAEVESVMDGSANGDNGYSPATSDYPGLSVLSDGQYVRQHLRLLKLALERLGDWPKNYAEYERLNADAFRIFPAELEGVDGVEKWDLRAYGSGKAESDDDLLDTELGVWDLVMPEEREEEL